MPSTYKENSSGNVTLIIPAASDGPHPRAKPTWLLMHPKGHPLLIDILSALDLTNVSRIILAVKKRHVEMFCGGDVETIVDVVVQHLNGRGRGVSVAGAAPTAATNKGGPAAASNVVRFDVHIFDYATESAPHTITDIIARCNVTGPMFVKDADGSFEHTIANQGMNYVVALKVTSENAPSIQNLPSKSFVEHNGGLLTNIQEKSIISDCICVGGYMFVDASEFVSMYTDVKQTQDQVRKFMATGEGEGSGNSSNNNKERLFVSHIIHRLMLHHGKLFGVSFTNRFEDWKTHAGWHSYVAQHRNIVVNLEGVLFRAAGSINKSTMSSPLDEGIQQPSATATSSLPSHFATSLLGTIGEPIKQNIQHLRDVYAGGKVRIVVTTTLDKAQHGASVLKLLDENAIPHDHVVFNMMRCTTYLVGAYDEDGLHHPSAVSYCVPSGSEQLGSVLHLSGCGKM